MREEKKWKKKKKINKNLSVCDDQQCFFFHFITINAVDSFSPRLVAATTFLSATVPTLQEQTNKQTNKRKETTYPTIVEGPRSPAKNFPDKHSMHAKRISGADDPSAMRVRFATVSFQVLT